jgi:hypothetical protein
MPFLVIPKVIPAFIRAELSRPAVCVSADWRPTPWAELFRAGGQKTANILIFHLISPDTKPSQLAAG